MAVAPLKYLFAIESYASYYLIAGSLD